MKGRYDHIECKACDAGLPISWWVQGKKDVHIGQGLSVVRCERIEAELAERKREAQSKRKASR